MSRKNEFPLIKVREDGMPGVWMSSSFWHMIKRQLMRSYLDSRGGMGRRRALIEAKQAKSYDLWPFDEQTAMDAIRFYGIGWKAYEQRQTDEFLKVFTPEELIARGDGEESDQYSLTLKEAHERAA